MLFLTRMLGRIRKRLTGTSTPPERYQWRTVESGPLKGMTLFLPEGSGRWWGGRIIAGTYELETVNRLAGWVGPSAVLYDIGAHIGFYSCMWVALGGGSVEAFEPVPAVYELLQETVRRNGLAGRVRAHDVALGDSQRSATILVDQWSLGASRMAFVEGIGGLRDQASLRVYARASRVACRLERLEDFVLANCLPHPAVMKIDVEGAEAAVIAGASTILTHARPMILVEIHSIKAAAESAQHLVRHGYSLEVCGEDEPRPMCCARPS